MELREVIESEFGLTVREITAGGRGALGEVWRVHRSAGGMGNLAEIGDFAMHVATSLNFLAAGL